MNAAPASAETIHLRPLSWLYTDDPQTLALGIPDVLSPSQDPADPTLMPRVPSQVRLRALDETAVNNSSWSSVSRQGQLDANYRFGETTPHDVWLAATVRGYSSNHHSKGDDDIEITQNATEQGISVAIQPRPNFTLGGGYVHDRNDTQFQYGVAADIFDSGRVSFRHYPLRTDLDARFRVDDRTADLNIASDSEVDQIGVQYEVFNTATIAFRSDLLKRLNFSGDVTLRAFEDWALVTSWSKDESEVTGRIGIDGTDSGALAGTVLNENKAIAVRYQWSRGTVLLGAASRRLDLAAVGNVEDNTLQDFWTYLLPGKRYFNARYGLRSTERFIAVSHRQSERLELRAGVQHADVTYTSDFQHWTTLPYFPLSKFDLSRSTDSESATVIGLSLGFRYATPQWEVSYAAAGSASPKAALRRHHGGNVQVIQFVWRLS